MLQLLLGQLLLKWGNFLMPSSGHTRRAKIAISWSVLACLSRALILRQIMLSI